MKENSTDDVFITDMRRVQPKYLMLTANTQSGGYLEDGYEGNDIHK